MQNLQLQKEIRKMHKVLQKEVGEGYSIENLLKSESTLKGRTEQIAILKEKVKQLNQRLQSSSRNDAFSKSSSRTTPTDHNGLYRLELTKRKELEKYQQELHDVKKQYAELKVRCDGLVARNKVLEDHKRETKGQINALLQKTESDDRYIEALKEKLKDHPSYSSALVQKLQVQIAEQEQTIAQMQKERETLTPSRSRLSIRDDSYDRLVESLQMEVQMFRQGKSQSENKLHQEQAQVVQLSIDC
jgi:chromosome segregation ATPase